jgi:plastocyanin
MKCLGIGGKSRCAPRGRAKIEPPRPEKPMHRATTAVAAAAALLAGCGGSGGYAPPDLTTAATPAPTRPPPAAGTLHVTIKDLAFAPHTITTTVGRPVEWINRDDVAHTVTTVDGATISSPRLAPGARFVYVPAKPGTLRYVCTIHPSTMSGVLIVH